MISKITILNAISDSRAFDIFRSIASARSNTDVLITHLKLTRKQYYSGMSLLIKAGLVKRVKGRYLLTALGRIVYTARLNLEAKFDSAIENYWKLKAIDSVQMSTEERRNLISAIIEDQEIKDILLNEEQRKSIVPTAPRNTTLTAIVAEPSTTI